jgi:menaquinol-cytochrome c reductase cytochrome b/c subunit
MFRLGCIGLVLLGVALAGSAFAQVIPIGIGGPPKIEVSAPPAVRAKGGKTLAEFRLGRRVAVESGCLACHRIGSAGHRAPGPNLTHVGSKLSPRDIERALVKPTAPMPSFKHLPPARFRALVVFLSLLRHR